MAGGIDYEEQRRRTVEANQRKMAELRLHHLSTAVQDSLPKPSPAKSVKRKKAPPREAGEDAPVRRSGRVASQPDKPKYRYEEVYAVFEKKISRGKRTTSTRKDLINRVYASDAAREYATTKAEELQDKLGSEYPTFVKPMSQSHVTGGFWLGLPFQFCRKYLPKRDERITLVDEVNDETDTLYLALKRGLSAGWRKFSIDHKLVDGDCLVFELIERTKFKPFRLHTREKGAGRFNTNRINSTAALQL